MAKGIDTPVVFTLSDLKKIYDRDSHGIKGMWAFHSKYHDGHAKCASMTNLKCDWVVGILWNNFAEGMRWMVGDTHDIDDPIRVTDVHALKEQSDVVMIFTGEYHPYKNFWNKIQNVIDRDFPEQLLIDKGIRQELTLYSSLIYSIAIRVLMHDIYDIHLDYHASCGRDMWRFVKYKEWLKDKFGLEQELLDAVRDNNGNVISGMRNRIPYEYNSRINKPLILPHFESLEQVNDHINDIKDLKAVHFSKGFGWIHVKFKFSDKYWWSEGLKL